MADLTSAPSQVLHQPSSISEIHILRLTAGLGCDGDTIAVTGTTQPSIEEIILGAFPWIPKVLPISDADGKVVQAGSEGRSCVVSIKPA
jgi:hypothetical protein